MPIVDVASSGKVPPLVSNVSSLDSSEEGMLTVKLPSAALIPDRATSTPADFTITTVPLAGPAATVPDTDVVVLEEALPDPLPAHPAMVNARTSSDIIDNDLEMYDFIRSPFLL
jgi:hypothetical protein